MSNKDREKEEDNRLRDWKKENQEEAKEVVIIVRQSVTHNRWRGLGAFLIHCQHIKYFNL
jgi:hypothetical protein